MTPGKRLSFPLLGGMALLAFFASHCGGDDGGTNGSGGQSASGGQGSGGASASGGSATGSGGSATGSGGSATGSGGSATGSGGSATGSGGLSSTIANVNGCTPASAEDHTAASDDRKVQVGPNGTIVFTPKCMTIKAGQSVSFVGTLAGHPFSPGNATNAGAGSPNNPITPTSSGNSASFTFPTPGAYAYYCMYHSSGAGDGMAGVVYVNP